MGDDFNLIAHLQLISKRHNSAADFRADAPVPDIAVDVVGEIERRGARGQVDHVAFRGKHVHAVIKDLASQFIEHFAGIGHLFLPGDKLTQPGDAIFVTVAHAACRAFFVFPVRRDPELRLFMHLFGANLDLDGFAAGAQHHGMNRLVAIRFGVRDVIVEFIRQVAVVRMNDPKRGVAVLQTLGDDAHRAHVEQLVKGQMLFLHLAPDAVDMFRTPVDFGFHALFFHGGAQMRNELVDVVFAIDAPLVQQFGDTFVFVRMQIAEAEILQLPFKLADAEAVRQRRIDIGALFRRQDAFIFRRVFHLAQMRDALSKLNDHTAEIIDHRQQHAANVIHLLGGDGVVMRGFELANSGHIAHAVDEADDRFADALFQHVFAHHAAVHQREEQRGAQRIDIHAEHGEDFHHLHTAPEQEFCLRMALSLLFAIAPGFG
ncbi:hypothetical protein BN133_2302 [Cronobacter dublinensis 582]|nr:hypothetical protein BN133_2302 [Cronobacter dublinensis 582]